MRINVIKALIILSICPQYSYYQLRLLALLTFKPNAVNGLLDLTDWNWETNINQTQSLYSIKN